MRNLLFLFHGLHVQYGFYPRCLHELPKRIQHLHRDLHPPLVINMEMTIGFSEVEVLNQELVDI